MNETAMLNRSISPEREAWPIAERILYRYRYAGVPREELAQEAQLALLETARTFAPAQGIAFQAYAFWAVRRACLRAVRRERSGGVVAPYRPEYTLPALARVRTRLREELRRDPTANELAAREDLPRDVRGCPRRIAALLPFLERPQSLDVVRTSGASAETWVETWAAEGDLESSVLLRLDLQAALARLTPPQRAVIRALYFAGERHAARSGRARSSMSRIRQRALRTLRREMQGWEA